MTNSRIGKVYENKKYREAVDIMVKLIKRAKTLYRKEIDTWRTAHQIAIQIHRPRRLKLTEVYDDIMLDAHLTSVIDNKLKPKIMNTPFILMDESSKKESEEHTELFFKKWFFDYLKHYIDHYGHGTTLLNLIEVVRPKPGKNPRVKLVPRDHVVPEEQLILFDPYNDNGIIYTDKPWNEYIIQIGETENLGFLLKAAPYAIFKKNAFGHWSKYMELMGIPMRIAKTASRDPKVQAEINKWLEEMGSAGYAVFPQGTEVDLIGDNNKTDASGAFDKGVDAVDKQLSKLVLGQTMTSDDGSSRAQGEVHERSEDELIKAKLRDFEIHFNDELKPFLISHGWPLQGFKGRFEQNTKLSKKRQWEIVNGILTQGYEVEQNWISETFDVPITGRKEKQLPPSPGGRDGDGANDPKESDDPEKGEKKK